MSGADEWIEWSGGECPVGPSDPVLIRTRDGWQDRTPERADRWAAGLDWWKHEGSDGNDIIAYRVVQS